MCALARQLGLPTVNTRMPKACDSASVLTKRSTISATVDAATLHHFGSVHEVVPREDLDEAALRVARDIAVKDTRVIRAAKEALNLIDVQRVNSSYRMEQGFTFELNLAGVADEHRDAFAGTDKGNK